MPTNHPLLCPRHITLPVRPPCVRPGLKYDYNFFELAKAGVDMPGENGKGGKGSFKNKSNLRKMFCSELVAHFLHGLPTCLTPPRLIATYCLLYLARQHYLVLCLWHIPIAALESASATIPFSSFPMCQLSDAKPRSFLCHLWQTKDLFATPPNQCIRRALIGSGLAVLDPEINPANEYTPNDLAYLLSTPRGIPMQGAAQYSPALSIDLTQQAAPVGARYEIAKSTDLDIDYRTTLGAVGESKFPAAGAGEGRGMGRKRPA